MEDVQSIKKVRRFKKARIITTDSRKYAIRLVAYPDDLIAAKLVTFQALQKQTGFFAVFGLCKITSHENTILIEGQIDNLEKIVNMMCVSFNPVFINEKQQDRLNTQLIEARQNNAELSTRPKPTEQNKEHLKATRQKTIKLNNFPKPEDETKKAEPAKLKKEHRKPRGLMAISSNSSNAFFTSIQSSEKLQDAIYTRQTKGMI